MKHLRYYEVEVRSPRTDCWEHLVWYEPRYRTVLERRSHWLFWTKDYVVVANLREAEEIARADAVAYAKAYRNQSLLLKRQVRVVAVKNPGDDEVREVIWQNGRFHI